MPSWEKTGTFGKLLLTGADLRKFEQGLVRMHLSFDTFGFGYGVWLAFVEVCKLFHKHLASNSEGFPSFSVPIADSGFSSEFCARCLWMTILACSSCAVTIECYPTKKLPRNWTVPVVTQVNTSSTTGISRPMLSHLEESGR